MHVITGGVDAFDAILYPEQNLANQNYLYQQVTNFSQTLNEVGRQFFDGARSLYNELNSSEAMRIARQAIKAAKNVFNPTHIVPLNTIEEIQNASPLMQRWVMACPEVRELYLNQQCAGYPDSYVNVFNDKLLDDHYDYRRVMDSVIVEEEDDYYIRYYPDELLDGDRELVHDEKVNILATWDSVKYYLQTGKKDPTDPLNGTL